MTNQTILFTGGGTMGPVTPLIAVLRRMRAMHPDLSFAWAGTPNGPERAVVEAEDVSFYPIPVAKLPRYPSLSWLTWPVQYARAVFAARAIIKKESPVLVASAGGFTSVPVMKAAKRKKIPCVIHQLDAEPGLSNAAVARFCSSVTTSFAYETDPPFRNVTSERIATPCWITPAALPTRQEALQHFGLTDRKTLLVLGGGTGALTLNHAVWSLLDQLLEHVNVIHSTGKGKGDEAPKKTGYAVKEFFDQEMMKNAYGAADLVVSRAGMGSISELASLSKPAIFVPIPKSHQEMNVMRLPSAILEQGPRFEERLLEKVLSTLQDTETLEGMGKRLHDALPTDDGTQLAERWLKIIAPR
jgi:UDP-N-acetylglucosamine--N-acetylmuramyl-(pentapeptide) pyrophosphoryl-undecaprenol N-acetylglucosamine transferase